MSDYIIDISKHNGETDLSKAKKYISGVVARCSYGWSSSNVDEQWVNNATQANSLGIPLFAYHFCYARNESEALKEAKLAVNTCKNYKVNIIYYDMEYTDTQGNLTNDMYYKIAKTFCDYVESQGFSAGIYANQDWFKNRLTNDGFSAWTLWLANYGKNNGYDNWNGVLQYNPYGNVHLHQFTSNAKNGVLKNIEGINSSGLDCSLDYGVLKIFGNVNKPENDSLKVGDKVKVKKGSSWYDGQSIASFVYDNEYGIIQINGNRVVIGINGKVTGAILLSNLIKAQ